MTTFRNIILGAAVALVAVSCGGSATETATAVIESEIADQIGLGDLEATCDQPDERVVGAEFPCTATTESGDVIRFTTTFEEEDRIFVLPTNVLLASDLPLLEQEAAEVLGPEVDAVIDPADIECPDTAVVLDENDQVTCSITDAASGTTYELIATLTDFVRDEGFQNRFYEVGAEIE